MFENLRDAFSSAAKSLGERELKEKDIEDVLFQLEISLLESDVATEVIDSIKFDLKKKLIGTKVNKKEIAKFAYLLQKSKFSVVVAAADTFRAGAIEQLKEHTSRLNLKIVAQNYGSDPAAVARDAVLYAKSHKIDCVLVDTAGRMQTSKNLMDQIAKIINVVKPDFKIFVGDSLAGNDTVNQAKEFHKHTKFDAAILTKSDADARGGAALSIVKVTSTPVLYVGVGQEYKDLKTFDKELFLETVFGKHDESEISITKEKVHETESKIDSKQVEETIPESQAIEESSRESQIT